MLGKKDWKVRRLRERAYQKDFVPGTGLSSKGRERLTRAPELIPGHSKERREMKGLK